jgi:hypothetical protein
MDLGIYLADFFVWTFGAPILVQALRVPDSPSDPETGQPGDEMAAVVNAIHGRIGSAPRNMPA